MYLIKAHALPRPYTRDDLGHPEVILSRPLTILGHLGSTLGRLEPSWGHLGLSWGYLGTFLGQSWGQEAHFEGCPMRCSMCWERAGAQILRTDTIPGGCPNRVLVPWGREQGRGIGNIVSRAFKTPMVRRMTGMTGSQNIGFDVADVTAGVYFLQLDINGQTTTQKITVAK